MRSHNRHILVRRWICLIVLVGSVLVSGELALSQEPVKIGYFGPADVEHPVGGTVWMGTQLAIAEANAEGGFEGRRFELVQGWDENPWSGGARSVVRMAYDERVVAVIGSINAEATHLAEQIVVKALVALIDPASTDRTVNAAFVPWMFSVMPDDRALMGALVEELAARPEQEPYTLVWATDHDSRMMAKEFQELSDRKDCRPARHFQFERASTKVAQVATQIAEVGAGAVVVLAGATDTAAMVRAIAAAQPDVDIYCGPSAGTRTFRRLGGVADGVRFPSPSVPTARSREFGERYSARFGEEPDYLALHAYDAACLLVAAIKKAGTDRAAIREATEKLSPWEGVSGAVTWDRLRRNSHTGVMVRFEYGKVMYPKP